MHGREHLDELDQSVAVVQVVEERLCRNPRASENERAAHESGIGMHRAVIERQHKKAYRLEWLDSLGAREAPNGKSSRTDTGEKTCHPSQSAEPWLFGGAGAALRR